MKTETLDITDFHNIEISNTFDFEIVQSDSFSVILTADEGLFRNLKVVNDAGTLRVAHSKHIGWKFRLKRPSAKITLPVLNGLRLTGAVSGKVNGFSSNEDFKLKMTGASRIAIEMDAGTTEFYIRGACVVAAKGTAESSVIDVNGACELDMKDFAVQNAAIKLNGTSKCTIKVDGRLDVRLSGISYLYWIGAPVMGEIRTSGLAVLSKVS